MKLSNPVYYLLATLSMLFWGLTFVWFKVAVEYWSPVTIVFIRLIISAVLLLAFGRASRKLKPIDKGDMKKFLLLAFCEPFLYFMGESHGLELVSSTVSSVIISTIPLITPLAAWLLYRERFSRELLLGILVSFIGIIIMIVNPNLSLNASPKGIALLFLAVFSTVGYAAFIRELSPKYNALSILTWQNLIGSVYFLPLFLIFDFNHFMSVWPNFPLIASVVQLALFGSTLAFLFFITVVSKLGMVKANVFTNLIPIFTAIAAYLIIDEKITLQIAIGMLLVLAGVFVAQYRSRRRPELTAQY